MKHRLWLFWIIPALFFSCGVEKHAPTIRFPYEWIGQQGFGGDIDQQDFPEPSGICYHPLRKSLFVVSDEGEISEIQTDGTPLMRMAIPGDLEGICVDPSTGFLYIVQEGEDAVLEFDPESRKVLRRFVLNREWKGDPNFIQKREEGYDNGIEAIAFVPEPGHPEGGRFYLSNQWDPPCVMEVHIPLRTGSKTEDEARILRVLPLVLDDPASMFYDEKSGLLNIVSDADNILVEVTQEGRIIHEYAFLGDNQEGLTRDEDGYLYIAQDTGGILKVKDLR
ncbi:MAG: SdiA-regulated domain-containing protein [Candidatus Aminicenantales bacterium]